MLPRISLLAVTLLFGAGNLVAAADPPRPNIMIILADDAGFSDIGCYGSEIKTPNIDALAAGGLRFTTFYNCARCCPSRASLLTGLYPHQAGMGEMAGPRPGPAAYRGVLPQSCVTIAAALRPAGYRTFMSGKWHVGYPPGPLQSGFDEFYGFRGGYAVDYFDPTMMIRLPADHPDTRHYAPGTYYSTDAITDHALDFMAEGRQTPDKPWFLYLAYNAPHFPLQAPQADIDKYAKVYERGWDVIRAERLDRLKQLGFFPHDAILSPRSAVPDGPAAKRDGFEGESNPPWDSIPAPRRADLARRMAVFAAALDHMDQQIGRVVADLKTHGQLDNTLLIFLSDNGACAEWDPWGFDFTLPPNRKHEAGVGINMGTPDKLSVVHAGAALDAMGGPGSYFSYGSGWANAGNTPFRMYKHYVYEGGISTPLIVHWPAGIQAHGEFRHQPGHIMDLMATCLDAAGAKYPTEVAGHAITPTPGKSLLPAFNHPDQSLNRDFLAWEHEGNRALRRGKWKLVALAGHPWELYDIETDREELHDLAAAQPEVVAELTKLYAGWAADVGVRPRKEPAAASGTPGNPLVSDDVD